jgi:hypothetical protein
MYDRKPKRLDTGMQCDAIKWQVYRIARHSVGYTEVQDFTCGQTAANAPQGDAGSGKPF